MLGLFSTEQVMQSYEFYYLVMVCGTFVVFAISLAASYI
jgi:hypothetical protein